MSLSTLGMRLCQVLSCLLCLSIVPSSILAAPFNNPGDQELIRDRQNRLLEDQQRRLEELKDLPGKSAAPTAPTTPADSRCFAIKDIQLKGADSL
ncbi:ShlB/FhaC/HecB family hemolysin secretion/activation protein, partial [Pseudomonas sp. Fl4BN1]|nr:ShlB/FhaC/HecB family hemolysin secretion/activation protein [Pseudomonas sp. Fl4BN1]